MVSKRAAPNAAVVALLLVAVAVQAMDESEASQGLPSSEGPPPTGERWDRKMVRDYISRVWSEKKAQKGASGEASADATAAAAGDYEAEDAVTYDVEFPAIETDEVDAPKELLAVDVLQLIRPLYMSNQGRVFEDIDYGTTVLELRKLINEVELYTLDESLACDFLYRRAPSSADATVSEHFSAEPLADNVRITTNACFACLSKRAKRAADIISSEANETMPNVLRWLATAAPPFSAGRLLVPFGTDHMGAHSIFNALIMGTIYAQLPDFPDTAVGEFILDQCAMPFLTAKIKTYLRRVFYVQAGLTEPKFESWTNEKKAEWKADAAKYAYTGTICDADSDCKSEEFCFPTVELFQPQRCSRLPIFDGRALFLESKSWGGGEKRRILDGLKNYVTQQSNGIEREWDMQKLFAAKGIDCTHAAEVQSQGTCATCWSFAAATSISIATCVASNGAFNAFVSPGSLVARMHELDLNAGSDAMPLSVRASTSGRLESYHVDALWQIVEGQEDLGVLPEACRPTICLHENKNRFKTWKDSIHAFSSIPLSRLGNTEERDNLVARETLKRLRIHAAEGKARGATYADEKGFKKALSDRTKSMVLSNVRSTECKLVPRILLKDFSMGVQVTDMVLEYGASVDMIYDHLRNKGPIVLSIPTKILEEKTKRSQPKERVYPMRRYYNYLDYDHSVILVGWGETSFGEKYWLIQNSWGKEWEDKGYFRVQRGFSEECIDLAISYYDKASHSRDSTTASKLAECSTDFLFAHFDMLYGASEDIMFPEPADRSVEMLGVIQRGAEAMGVPSCLNGGVMNADMVCLCPVKFTGSQCELCNTKRPKCNYGKWNNDTCECNCPPGRFGPDCNTKVEVAICAGPGGEAEARITQSSVDAYNENDFVDGKGKPLVMTITLYDARGQIIDKKDRFGGYTEILANAMKLGEGGRPFAVLGDGVTQAIVDVPNGTNEFGKLLYAKHEIAVLDERDSESSPHCT